MKKTAARNIGGRAQAGNRPNRTGNLDRNHRNPNPTGTDRITGANVMSTRDEALEIKYSNYQFEVKALKDMEFEGYASVFGNVDRGDDIVISGAFTKALADYHAMKRMPKMYWFHRPDQVPGKWLDM